jgi:hypothetical protein
LRPRERPAGAGLVDDDEFGLVFLAKHRLLPARHDVGFAAGDKRDDVLNVFFGIRGVRVHCRASAHTGTQQHSQSLQIHAYSF